MRKLFTFVAALFAALTLNAEPITVAQAIEACNALEDNATSGSEFTVEGFVVDAEDFNWGTSQQIWYMSDDKGNASGQVFQAYYCTAQEDGKAMPVLNGDKIQLTGKLTKYVDKDSKIFLEIKNGKATFVSKVDGDRARPKEETITVAQALTLGASVAQGTTGSVAYNIVGYVTAYEGKNDDGGWEKYGNQLFWIADTKGSQAKSNADGAFEVYQGVASEKVNIGDKVSVYTKIKNYNGILESETRAPVTILEKGEGGQQEQEDADVVFDKNDFAGQGTATTGSEVKATKNGVTFWCDKAYGDGQYGVRCYKPGTIKITSTTEQIGKIVFEFGVVSEKKMNGDLDDEYIVNGMEWKAENITTQSRMNKIKIYFGAFEDETPELPEGVITCAAAVELAALIKDPAEVRETVQGDNVMVRGYVTYAYEASEKGGYKTQSVWIADKKGSNKYVIQAVHLQVSEAVSVGDYVHVEGALSKYLKEGKDGKPNEVIIEVINGTMRKAKEGEMFIITTRVTPEYSGQVTVEGTKLTATPNTGYYFSRWSDGITDNPRTIELTKDTTLTAIFAPNMYSFSATCNPEEGEIDAVNGEYPYLTNLTITATPKYGYHFVYWSDGEYNSQRTITITRDIQLYAYFERNTYSVTAAYNPQGTISGTGSFLYKTECSVRAIPNSGYHFVEWLDGVKANPRTFVLTQDTVFAALFAIDTTGVCGKDYKLSWAYNAESKRLTISGNGSFDENMNCGLEAKQKMVELVIDEGVTAIGNEAFSNCENLATIQLPASVKTIGERAFYNCLDLTSIYNYRENPCLIKSSTFEEVNTFDCTLYVLKESISKYQSEGSGWKIFYEIKPIGTTSVDEPITDVETQPNDNNVVVTWPISDNAETYTLEITKDGVVFCTLIFNAEGQLRGIAFAPTRRGEHQASFAEKTANGGLRFTVTGLESATDYQLTVKAKDADEKEIASYTSEFTTTGIADAPQALDQITNDQLPITNKVIRNGQLLILRGDKVYTVDGQQVK